MWEIFEVYIVNQVLLSLKCKRAFKIKGKRKDQQLYTKEETDTVHRKRKAKGVGHQCVQIDSQ